MKKPVFAYVTTKAQISYAVTAQRLCFRFITNTIPLNPKPLAIWFVSDLVGNPEDRFSCNKAYIYLNSSKIGYCFPSPEKRIKRVNYLFDIFENRVIQMEDQQCIN